MTTRINLMQGQLWERITKRMVLSGLRIAAFLTHVKESLGRMPGMNPMQAYYISIALKIKLSNDQKALFSEFLKNAAEKFHTIGIYDWHFEVSENKKVLGIEREFHDLTGRAQRIDKFEVYFTTKKQAQDFRLVLLQSVEGIAISLPKKQVPLDWTLEWRKYYKVQLIGKGKDSLQIVPSWIKPKKNHTYSIKIYPGQAFGAGTHSTTRLCLLWIQGLKELSISSVLDFGAGTGILACGANCYWPKIKKTVCVESDPAAREICEKNLKLNGLKGQTKASLTKEKFDLVLANVLEPVLLLEKKRLIESVAPGGMIVLSGILAKDARSFEKKFSARELKLQGKKTDSGWISFVFRKI